MKGNDIRTLENVLKEYGMKSGVSTPVGQQSSGKTAKATAATRASDSPTSKPSQSNINKPSASPSTSAAQPTQTPLSKAKELKKDFEFTNDKGEAVKVVSAFGQGENKEDVVVQNQKTKEFYSINPDDDVELPVEEDSNPLAKVKSHRLRTGKKGQRSIKLGRKIKKLSKLIRKHKLSESPLFEINFNDPKLAKTALAGPIACGFEAETVWNDVEAQYPDDDDSWLDGASWRYVRDLVYDQEGSRSVDAIEETYREWLGESNEFYDINSDVINEMVRDRKEDESYIDDFVSDEISQEDIQEYKERTIAQLEGDKDDGNEEATGELEEREDWDDAAWAREYVEEIKYNELEEWLAEKIRDNGEDWDETWDRAMNRYDIDYWCDREHGGNWYSVLMDEDIYLVNPEGGSGGGVAEVAEQFIEPWAQKNSEFENVKSGGYHDNYGDTTQDYWRVEDDASISGNGAGAEIISPVYSTPEKMLKEMKSLFEYMEQNDAETNSSTGLHITMSWNGQEGAETNRLKMALLLGDQYVAQQFNRENNTYAQSQYKKIQEYLQNLKTNINDENSLEGLEKILNKGVDSDKFRTIHFKNDKNENGNNLIEFRVAGGRDYHADYNKIVKTVIRYAAIMQAGHDTTAYRRDYIKAIFRAINGKQNVDQLGTPEQLPAAPIVDVAKDLVGEKYYRDVLEALMAAYNSLKTAKQMKDKDPQKDLFGEAEGDAETQTGPEWAKYFVSAKEQLAKAFTLIAVSTAAGQNRNKITARAITVFRNTLKEFGMDYKELWNEVENTMVYRKFISGNSVNGHNTLKSGFDKMFRAELGQEKKAAFKLEYKPGDTILLPAALGQALKDSGVTSSPFDSNDNGQRTSRPALKAEDFVIIDADEFERVRRQRYEKENVERDIGSAKQEIDHLTTMRVHSVFPEVAKERLRQQQERVADLEAEVSEYNTDINAFMKKWGFVPNTIRSGSEWIGKPMRWMNRDDLRNIADAYNIEIEGLKQESVFTKLNKLSLEEQLKFISKLDEVKLNEAWSKKYKDSINCSNPKGFSQKAHCAGKKKKVKEGVAEGAVPDNSKKRKIHQLMNKPMLASDIGAQMEAYFVMPDPSMIKAFRQARAAGGDTTDLRSIFKGFLNNNLHPLDKKQVGLKDHESK